MNRISATNACSRLRQVLEQAQVAQMNTNANCCDGAIEALAAEYQRRHAAAQTIGNDLRVRALLLDTMHRREALYRALAR
jgi:succinylarginine dihydrolase